MAVGHGTGTAFAINHASGVSTLDTGNGTIIGGDALKITVGAIVFAAAPTGVTMVIDPTGTNQAMTFLGSVSSSSGYQIQWFGILAPAAVASKGLRAAWTGATKAVFVGDTFTGADQGSLAATAVFSSQTGTSTAPSITITTANADATVEFVCDNETASLSAPTPQTLISAIDNAIIDCGAGYILSTTTSDTHGWTYGSSVPWAMGGLRIRASGSIGGGGVTYPQTERGIRGLARGLSGGLARSFVRRDRIFVPSYAVVGDLKAAA